MTTSISLSSNSSQNRIGTALITGATSGIGLAYARALAATGHAVILVARRESLLQQIAAGLPGAGHEVLAADLAFEDGIRSVEERLALGSKVNIVINNAGNGRYGTFHQGESRPQSDMVVLNCEALTRLAHAFLRRAGEGDCLVNLSSVLAFMPQPTSAVYAASKAYVTAFSEALWFENKTRGVYVMALHPGITRTEFRVRAGGTPEYSASAQSPEQVVAVGMRHMRLRKHPSVFCGQANAWLARIPRLLSRKSMVGLMGSTRSYDP